VHIVPGITILEIIGLVCGVVVILIPAAVVAIMHILDAIIE